MYFEIAEPLLLHGPEPEGDQMPRQLLAQNEKLQYQVSTLENEKEQLEKRSKEQADETVRAEMEHQ